MPLFPMELAVDKKIYIVRSGNNVFDAAVIAALENKQLANLAYAQPYQSHNYDPFLNYEIHDDQYLKNLEKSPSFMLSTQSLAYLLAPNFIAKRYFDAQKLEAGASLKATNLALFDETLAISLGGGFSHAGYNTMGENCHAYADIPLAFTHTIHKNNPHIFCITPRPEPNYPNAKILITDEVTGYKKIYTSSPEKKEVHNYWNWQWEKVSNLSDDESSESEMKMRDDLKKTVIFPEQNTSDEASDVLSASEDTETTDTAYNKTILMWDQPNQTFVHPKQKNRSKQSNNSISLSINNINTHVDENQTTGKKNSIYPTLQEDDLNTQRDTDFKINFNNYKSNVVILHGNKDLQSTQEIANMVEHIIQMYNGYKK